MQQPKIAIIRTQDEEYPVKGIKILLKTAKVALVPISATQSKNTANRMIFSLLDAKTGTSRLPRPYGQQSGILSSGVRYLGYYE